MSTGDPKRPWEQRLHEAAGTVEDELKRVIKYLNDEVVPEVRQSSSDALRAAGAEMNRLASGVQLGTQQLQRRYPPPPPSYYGPAY